MKKNLTIFGSKFYFPSIKIRHQNSEMTYNERSVNNHIELPEAKGAGTDNSKTSDPSSTHHPSLKSCTSVVRSSSFKSQ